MRKIHIYLGEKEWHGFSVESLWAVEVGKRLYKLANSPFFANNLSFGDVVETVERDGQLHFSALANAAVRSTYRIIPAKDCSEHLLNEHLGLLNEAGCTYEHGNFGFELFALDVPAEVDVLKIYALLEEAEQLGVWGFEEGNCGHRITPH